jgi:hypothetical protein
MVGEARVRVRPRSEVGERVSGVVLEEEERMGTVVGRSEGSAKETSRREEVGAYCEEPVVEREREGLGAGGGSHEAGRRKALCWPCWLRCCVYGTSPAETDLTTDAFDLKLAWEFLNPPLSIRSSISIRCVGILGLAICPSAALLFRL